MADYSDWLQFFVYHNDDATKQKELYQGLGPGNCSLMFYGHDVSTEQMQQIFDRYGGRFGENVAWQFQQKGQILLSKFRSGCRENTLVLEGLGAGADDVLFQDHDVVQMITSTSKLQQVKDILELEDIPILQYGLVYWPNRQVVLDGENKERLCNLLRECSNLEGLTNIMGDFWYSDESFHGEETESEQSSE